MAKMELSAYQDAAEQICEEIAVELHEYDLEILAQQCRSLGRDAVLTHAHSNKNLLHKYICSDPQQRADILAEIHPTARALTVLCALYHARCGLAFLTSVCVRGISAGPSHALITAQSASAAHDLRDSWPDLWPFEERPKELEGW